MKILVVEDEVRIADGLKKGLELKNQIVDVAYDGDTGVDLALNESYDVMILDRMLPGIDGLELVTQIRKAQIQTPILMLTAKNLIDDRVEGLEAGADDYLGKPFAFEELLARLQALTRRPLRMQTTQLQIANLSLDLQSLRVKRAGSEIKLSKKEYELLEFLARHQGQIFTSEQLVEKVWPFESDVLPNTAQVYVGYLRKKIDKAFPESVPLIQTHKGFGYSLSERHV